MGLAPLVLVGEAPGPRSLPGDPPLAGEPARRLGLLMGPRAGEVLALNLLPAWPGRQGRGSRLPAREAGEAARALLPRLGGRRVVALGRRVLRALGEPGLAPLAWSASPPPPLAALGHLPHPSGLCRWWNDPAAWAAAREFLLAADWPGGGPGGGDLRPCA